MKLSYVTDTKQLKPNHLIRLSTFSQYRNDSDIYSSWIEMYDPIKLIICKKNPESVTLFK